MMKAVRFLLAVVYSLQMTYAQTGPGGVGSTDGSSNLKYWLNASEGIISENKIISIEDLSGNSVKNIITGGIKINPSSINGYDAITFDGIRSGKNKYDQIVTDLSINNGLHPNITIIAVYIPASENSGGVWGDKKVNGGRYIMDNGGYYSDVVGSGAGTLIGVGDIFPENTPVITSVAFQNSSSSLSYVFKDAGIETTFTSFSSGVNSSNFTIGTIGHGHNSNTFHGDIAEVIVYEEVSVFNLYFIHNYLGAKYGIELSSIFDLYTQDNPENGDFDHDVAGIGRVLLDVNDDAQGTGVVRISNPSNLGNNEFMFWGHNNGSLEMIDDMDMPSDLTARLEREWRVSEVNIIKRSIDVGPIDIQFDLSEMEALEPSDLRLLVDTNNDGSFDDETGIDGAVKVGEGIYQFTNVSEITDNARFTLGTVQELVDLPIVLSYFTAEVTSSGQVYLEWETASEINNDYFTVYRSRDGRAWEEIGRIDGAGNSSVALRYSMIDYSPLEGTSFYYLKQTDFDGKYEYSETAKVTVGRTLALQVNVFPNPVTSEVCVEGSALERDQLRIYNSVGQEVTLSANLISKNEYFSVFDFTNFKQGMYYIKTRSVTKKVFKK
ncbi:T9SS type A sorting domain-containing protein [Flammeovirga aprica]|uniref:T9SS type A sorting domain-containing protein n=1 Tax=Flammeovirga aprica JL-4 TaxID=694437 RepID=A0A7X9S0R1_9BACT|nr:T9SS type A sorting domain-containing protein [Flammeovirga aprica]NME72285.1 T9SS type A sorting domain-containing protein [Flammeovirga aprica JL-4]